MADNVPQDLKYTKEHEWVRVKGTHAVVGITQHAQQQLGDVVFVELPALGDQLEAGGEAGTVESVKAVSEIYTPLSGKVVKVNQGVVDDPETLNTDPYGEGWIFELEFSDSKAVADLMDASAYEKYIQEAQ